MEIIKKIRLNRMINAVITIIIGILFCVNPYGASNTIAVVSGIMILCSGVFDIVRYIMTGRYTYFLRGSLFTGVLKCILGLFILTHTSAMVALFTYIFSIFIIVNGVTCIEYAGQLARAGVTGWIVNMFLAVLITGAGIIMLFHPIGTAVTAAVFLGAVLIADGATEIFTIYRMKKIGKEFYRTLKDMKDEIDGNIIDM